MPYIKKVLRKNRTWTLVYILIGIFNSFLVGFQTSYFQKIVDGLTDRSLTAVQIAFYACVLVTGFLVRYLDEYPAKKLEHGIFLDFKRLALGKIGTIDFQQYQQMGTGSLIQRIENGAQAGRDVVFHFWLRVIRQLIPTILFSLFFIWQMNHPITYALLAGYVVVFVVTNLLLRKLYQIKERILNNEERFNHFLVRGFMEMVVFRLARQFPNELRKADHASSAIVSTKVKMNMVHEAFFTIFALLTAALDVGILTYAWKNNVMSVGAVVALIALVDNAYAPIAIFNVLYVQYKLDLAAFARYNEFLNLQDDPQLEQGIDVSALSGDIRVQGLYFSYAGRELFDDLSLRIHPGEKVAFVGESGSGKSTLAKLLAGLLKYRQGSICVDGLELRDIRLHSLYEQMAYLSQDAPVFDGTIRENLVFDQDVSDAALEEILDRMHLLPFLRSAPDGLQTRIGERGAKLSGGEKQRLAMARLCLQCPTLAILDEATSAMDNITEKQVMETLLHALPSCTVIAIAHRLESVANFDRIIVFRQGRIVGEGTYQALQKDNAYFLQLLRAGAQAKIIRNK